MRQSKYFINTLRQTPSDAEVISHKLMMRASMIKKVASGVYTYLPLALRAIRKFEAIVRKHMNAAGAIELLMPTVQPSELWKESKRWDHYGKELLRFKDRHDHEFCLGPTHEEVITNLVANTINTYKQLPVNLYQIQTKFRDEVRPRFGLMRGREFVMKDAYSFDIDSKGAEESYKKMHAAYSNIFTECGFEFKIVDADSGSIGGSFSHEFMLIAESGEDEIIYCDSCNYAANVEKAEISPEQPGGAGIGTGTGDASAEELLMPEEVATPNAHSVADVAKFLSAPEYKIAKTMVVKVTDDAGIHFAAVFLSGVHELNLIKLKNFLNADEVDLASARDVQEAVHASFGSIGPLELKIPVYADNAVKNITNMIVGANKDGYHIKNINAGRDFTPTAFGDFRNAEVGDVCCRCKNGKYKKARGIEVGHIFKLGTKYSSAMNAKIAMSDGSKQDIVMGCYGIGISRVVAASIEQNHDDRGIIWPRAIAPFEIAILPLNMDDNDTLSVSEKLYSLLINNGVDVILDDRSERPGVKLNDADLIGYPIRVSVGKKSLASRSVEVYIRRTGETHMVEIDNSFDAIIDILGSIK